MVIDVIQVEANLFVSISESESSLNHLLAIRTGDGVKSGVTLNPPENNTNPSSSSSSLSLNYGGIEQFYSQGENAWSFRNHPLMGMISFHHDFRYPHEVEVSVLNLDLKSSGLQWDVRGETNYDANTISMTVSRRDISGFEKFSSHILGNYDISSIPYSWYVCLYSVSVESNIISCSCSCLCLCSFLFLFIFLVFFSLFVL
jgi:hypothetical protein